MSEPAATSSPKNWSETQILGSYPRTTKLDTLEVDIIAICISASPPGNSARSSLRTTKLHATSTPRVTIACPPAGGDIHTVFQVLCNYWYKESGKDPQTSSESLGFSAHLVLNVFISEVRKLVYVRISQPLF